MRREPSPGFILVRAYMGSFDCVAVRFATATSLRMTVCRCVVPQEAAEEREDESKYSDCNSRIQVNITCGVLAKERLGCVPIGSSQRIIRARYE
jgi:hypothetical protein